MGTLDAFFKGNAKPIENIEMVVSKRFTDEQGKPIPWVIKRITAQESNMLRKKHTKRTTTKLGRKDEEFNGNAYQEDFITASIIFPDLSDAELQHSYNALGEYDLLQKMLTADEFAELQIRISGIAEEEAEENSMDNLIEEVKND